MAKAIGGFLTIVAIVFGNVMLARTPGPGTLAAFVLTAASIIALLALIGGAIKGRAAGVIIDNRNRVSFSKLQAVAWTIIILSGLITIAALRIRLARPDPLGIELDANLLIVMGISAGSMVATPALLSLKTDAPAAPDQIADARELGAVQPEGKVFGRPAAECASWLDIFRGDELSNCNSPDLSKIQQFLITGLLLGYYAITLGQMCLTGANPAATTADKLAQLPTFSNGMAWLIGISHAGYLGYKAAPHSGPNQAAVPVEEVG